MSLHMFIIKLGHLPSIETNILLLQKLMKPLNFFTIAFFDYKLAPN